MRKIKKIFLTAFTSFSLFHCNNALAYDTSYFVDNFKRITQMYLDSYQEKVKEKLLVSVIDANTEEAERQKMLSKYFSKLDWFVAVSFAPDIRKNTSMCPLILDNNNLYEIDSYMNDNFVKKIDSIYYLAAHEIGHCFAFHQRHLGKIKYKTTEENEELIAELNALLFFLTRNDEDNALAVIKRNAAIKKSEPHYHPDELKIAFLMYKNQPIKVSNMYNLFGLTFEYFKLTENISDADRASLKRYEKFFNDKFNSLNKRVFTFRTNDKTF